MYFADGLRQGEYYIIVIGYGKLHYRWVWGGRQRVGWGGGKGRLEGGHEKCQTLLNFFQFFMFWGILGTFHFLVQGMKNFKRATKGMMKNFRRVLKRGEHFYTVNYEK